jgi:ribosomal protein S18 acetylase RimI-like enzyme
MHVLDPRASRFCHHHCTVGRSAAGDSTFGAGPPPWLGRLDNVRNVVQQEGQVRDRVILRDGSAGGPAAVTGGAVYDKIESSLALAHDDGHAVLLALLDGQVAGMISVAERKQFAGETDAYIGELVTDCRMEGRGVGRGLVAAAEEWAASRGLSRITLETGARNDRAPRLYEGAGYQEEDIRLTKSGSG